MAAHKFFCKSFAAFQLSRFPGRADERDVDELWVSQEIIADTQDQGLFGPDEHQIDLVLERSSSHGGKIVGIYWQVGCRVR